MMKFLLLMLVSFPVLSEQNVDEKLAGYIQQFNLKTLSVPAARKQKLFIIGRNLFHEKVFQEITISDAKIVIIHALVLTMVFLSRLARDLLDYNLARI